MLEQSEPEILPIVEFFRGLIEPRQNQSISWYGTDTEEQFQEQRGGIPSPYGPNDITYKFNSHGFRCDEFNVPSDLPILFTGCSVTEGVGLPLQDVWSYLLLEKIREKTGLQIPYWNLAIAGGSFDTMVETLMWFSKNVQAKPKLIIPLFPAVHRREFCFESSSVRWWSVHAVNYYPRNINELFMDDYFSVHQSCRSVQTIEALRMYFNATCVYSSWHLLKHHAFDVLQQSHAVKFPPHIMNKDSARDMKHFGPRLHRVIALRYWKTIEPLLN